MTSRRSQFLLAGKSKAALQTISAWNFNGPIKKDKLFFFVGQNTSVCRLDFAPVNGGLPTRAERLGDFSLRLRDQTLLLARRMTESCGILPMQQVRASPRLSMRMAALRQQQFRDRLFLRERDSIRLLTLTEKPSLQSSAPWRNWGRLRRYTNSQQHHLPAAENPLDWREDNARIDYRFNEKHSI